MSPLSGIRNRWALWKLTSSEVQTGAVCTSSAVAIRTSSDNTLTTPTNLRSSATTHWSMILPVQDRSTARLPQHEIISKCELPFCVVSFDSFDNSRGPKWRWLLLAVILTWWSREFVFIFAETNQRIENFKFYRHKGISTPAPTKPTLGICNKTMVTTEG